jgi:hypothetical protein
VEAEGKEVGGKVSAEEKKKTIATMKDGSLNEGMRKRGG